LYFYVLYFYSGMPALLPLRDTPVTAAWYACLVKPAYPARTISLGRFLSVGFLHCSNRLSLGSLTAVIPGFQQAFSVRSGSCLIFRNSAATVQPGDQKNHVPSVPPLHLNGACYSL